MSFLAVGINPQTYNEAMDSENQSNWQTAMEEEVEYLPKNEVWALVEKPEKMKIFENRWVYRVKYNPDGDISQFR